MATCRPSLVSLARPSHATLEEPETTGLDTFQQ
jgi:hypothetical protein